LCQGKSGRPLKIEGNDLSTITMRQPQPVAASVLDLLYAVYVTLCRMEKSQLFSTRLIQCGSMQSLHPSAVTPTLLPLPLNGYYRIFLPIPARQAATCYDGVFLQRILMAPKLLRKRLLPLTISKSKSGGKPCRRFRYLAQPG